MFFAFLSSLALTGTPAIIPPLPAIIDGSAIIADYRYRNRNVCRQHRVVVELIARGNDWGNVWINEKPVFQPQNFNRRKTLNLCAGAYRVVFTGITSMDVWDSGYLDLGRSNVVKLSFTKNGVEQVEGDPNAWLPDDRNDPDVWRRNDPDIWRR